MSFELPPTYSQDDGDHLGDAASSEPQILILPTANSVGFQKGYLGAEGERAAIEGELQIKGADSDRWGKLSMSLRTVETAYQSEIELGSSEIILFAPSSSPVSGEAAPSTYPFSIPLPPNTPQCIHTPYSSLTHTLTATLHPVNPSLPELTRSLSVHTRRYTCHSYDLNVVPETRVIDDPTRVELQVPRTTFKTGEKIPLYLTVPSPRRELILDEGLRLRNIRAELVRNVKVRRKDDQDDFDDTVGDFTTEEADAASPSTSTPAPKHGGVASSHTLDMRSFLGVPGGGEVIALSGASCRLHPSRPIQIRLVLHPPHEQSPLTGPSEDLPTGEPGHPEASVECATISARTLLHSVSFMVCVHITFMHMRTHTERVSTISIPITILPPSAPLPEVEESLASAYHKKHDRPPTRTVRGDDSDVPHYEEGEAGPSFLASGAPPPFEEREAPPPFFSAEPEASTSRPPTFLESETEIYIPPEEDPSIAPPPPPPTEPVFEGEGTLFGFLPSQQFDGYNQEQRDRSVTPPPTLEMATMDADVTGLANLDESAAINVLELALEQHSDAADDHLPPPPPPMDDPSDPPPSIDSEFRSSPARHQASSSPHPSSPLIFAQPGDPMGQPLPALSGAAPPPVPESHGHAPPPYRVPNNEADHDDHEHVAHPPPYVDFLPAHPAH